MTIVELPPLVQLQAARAVRHLGAVQAEDLAEFVGQCLLEIGKPSGIAGRQDAFMDGVGRDDSRVVHARSLLRVEAEAPSDHSSPRRHP